MILGNESAAQCCAVPEKERVKLLGIAVEETAGDGPASIQEIAGYDHLKQAYTAACRQAGLDFREEFLQGRALLEVYTCYPVVPMAFLLASGIAGSFKDLETVLDNFEVTVTGGMNIARAPWNNPALRACICMFDKLRTGSVKQGAVHGNGGLGFKQGVAIMGAEK